MKFLLRSLLFASCALLLAAAASGAAPAAVEGFTYKRTVGAISEYTLDSNGLTALVLSDRTAPVVTFMVTYHVGSRNEVTGTTGATHLLEHMMFKGSTSYNREKKNSISEFLESIGGNYNASTWLDRTNYYAETGSEHLEGYMRIEADRMRNLLLRESDRQPEMTVVRNEYEQGENDPQQTLDKEIFAAAFQAHPYHHSTIGWRSDIEKVPIEKLKAFYDTFYWPDNATVSLIGDVDPAAGLALVKKYYGVFPKAPHPIPEMYTEEPEQTGPRRVIVRRAGELGVVGISYKSPAGSHPDFPALGVLTRILAIGKTSRFYRTLIDKNLATNVTADAGYFHDPSLFQLYAFLAPGVEQDKVEQALSEEVERVKKDGVTDTEVATAISKFVASTAYARDGSFAIASKLNEDIAAGDWTLYYRLEDATKKVTAADVKRVANLYLDLAKSTTGWFIPNVAPAEPAPAK